MTKKYDDLEMCDKVLSNLSNDARKKEVLALLERLDQIDRDDIEAVVVGMRVKGHEDSALVAMAGRRSEVFAILDVMCGKALEMEGVFDDGGTGDERPN